MDAKRLQRELRDLGYYPTRCYVDGIIGRYTRAGIRALQYDLIAAALVDEEGCDYEPKLDFEVTDDHAGGVHDIWQNTLNAHVPTRSTPLESLDFKSTLSPINVPACIMRAIFHHESSGGHWQAVEDGEWIVRYGVDYIGSDPRKPGDDCKEPWIKSRGWGLGQITPPGDRSLPPRDHLGGSPAASHWPPWILSASANLIASAEVLRRLRPVDSKGKAVQSVCYGTAARYECGWCPRCGQPGMCPWWYAARRYAGSGKGADRAVDEFVDVLRSQR